MIEELQALRRVVNDLKTAIDNYAPLVLAELFNTYGQYAQVLCAEGLHRHLADESLSLDGVRQHFTGKSFGGRLQGRDLDLKVGRLVLDNTPANLHNYHWLIKRHPEYASIIAENLQANPSLLNGHESNRDHPAMTRVNHLPETLPPQPQSILIDLMNQIGPLNHRTEIPMKEELQALRRVVNDLKAAIDNNAPEVLAELFKTYGQYAQMLCAEGLHRHLSDESLSLEGVRRHMTGKSLTAELHGRHIDSEVGRLVLENTPANLHNYQWFIKRQPEYAPTIANTLQANPSLLFNGFESSKEESAMTIMNHLAKALPEQTQAILIDLMREIPGQDVGLKFVSGLVNWLQCFDYLDVDLRAVIADRQRLIIPVFDLLTDDSTIHEFGTPCAYLAFHKLRNPEILKALMKVDFFAQLGETSSALKAQEILPLLDISLPLDAELTLSYLDASRSNADSAPAVFMTMLYLGNAQLPLEHLVEAYAMKWIEPPSRRVFAYEQIKLAIPLLKEIDRYDEARTIDLIEQMHALLDASPAYGGTGLDEEFARFLPRDLLLKTHFNERIAKDVLEIDLGL